MTTSLPTILDLTQFRDITENDRELEADLFNEFIKDSSNLVEELHTTLEQDERPAFRKAAHALKGISLNLGARHLADLAFQAQQNFEGPSDDLQNLFHQIRDAQSVVTCLLEKEMA
ncbi:MAG: Hpt domain-containing protein [Pseudobdellovibrionaceae bacterium]